MNELNSGLRWSRKGFNSERCDEMIKWWVQSGCRMSMVVSHLTFKIPSFDGLLIKLCVLNFDYCSNINIALLVVSAGFSEASTQLTNQTELAFIFFDHATKFFKIFCLSIDALFVFSSDEPKSNLNLFAFNFNWVYGTKITSLTLQQAYNHSCMHERALTSN